MKKISIAMLGILIILSHQVLSLQITEIMFNPDGADTGREWIEIELNSSDGCVNLTEYRLFEEGTNHNIYKNNSDITCRSAIISSDVAKFFQDYPYINNTNIFVYKSTFSLSNSGENIAIKKGNEIVDEINYTLLIENINITEGHSLEYYSNYWRNSELLKGNPGNIIAENVSVNNSIIENSTNITNTIDDNTTNNTINTTNTTTNNYCNITLNIVIKNASAIYENDVSIKFQNKIEKDNLTNTTNIDEVYVIEYWVEDLFGNIVKNKVSTTNQDEKSFTPKIDETDKILIIKNVLKNISCNLSNISNTSGEKIILVKNSKYTPTTSKQPTCPTCSSKATACESCVCPETQKNIQNSSSPLIKIINVCNTSQETQKTVTQNSFELSQAQIRDSSFNNTSNKTLAQTAGQTTSMVIYESPNLKNRLYALIGLVLVGLSCIGIIVYKLASKAPHTPKIE